VDTSRTCSTLAFLDDEDPGAGAAGADPRAARTRDDLAMLIRTAPYTLWRDAGFLSPGRLIGLRLGRERVPGTRHRRGDVPRRAAGLARVRKLGTHGGLDTTRLRPRYGKQPASPCPGGGAPTRRTGPLSEMATCGPGPAIPRSTAARRRSAASRSPTATRS